MAQEPIWFPDADFLDHPNLVENVLDRHTGGECGTRCAYIWEGDDGSVRRLTYDQLHVEVNRAANALLSLGLKQGDCVGVYMPVLVETIVVALATIKLGGIFVPLSPGLPAKALGFRLRDAGARWAVTADGFYRRGKSIELKARLDEALAHVPQVEQVIVVARTGSKVTMQPGRDVWWRQAVAQQSAKAQTVAVDPDAPVYIWYPPQSTGIAKGTVWTHIGLLRAGIEEVRLHFNDRDDKAFLWADQWGWAELPLRVISGVGCAGGTLKILEGA